MNKELEKLIKERDLKQKEIQELDIQIGNKRCNITLSDYDIGELSAKLGDVNIAYKKYHEKCNECDLLNDIYRQEEEEYLALSINIGKQYGIEGHLIRKYIENFKVV